MFQELSPVLLTGSWDNNGDLERGEARGKQGLGRGRPYGSLLKLDKLDIAEEAEAR